MNPLRARPSVVNAPASLLSVVLLLLAALICAPAQRGAETGSQFGSHEGWQAGQTAIVPDALRPFRSAMAPEDGDWGDDDAAASQEPRFRPAGHAGGTSPTTSGLAQLAPAAVRPQSPRAPPFLA